MAARSLLVIFLQMTLRLISISEAFTILSLKGVGYVSGLSGEMPLRHFMIRVRIWDSFIPTLAIGMLSTSVFLVDLTPFRYSLLSRWVWSTVVRASLGVQRQKLNSHRVRKVEGKLMPDKGTPNQFMADPLRFGALHETCLHSVDRTVVKQMMMELGGETLLHFVDPAFDTHCHEVHRQIGSPSLEPKDAWATFFTMLPHVTFPEET